MRAALTMTILLWALLPATAAAQALAGSEWRPVMLGELEAEGDKKLFVQFDSEGKLTGHAGCNRFFASYEVSGERLRVGPIGATRMACEAPAMELEAAFLAALEGADSFHRDGTVLQLFDDAGAELARLWQTDWD